MVCAGGSSVSSRAALSHKYMSKQALTQDREALLMGFRDESYKAGHDLDEVAGREGGLPYENCQSKAWMDGWMDGASTHGGRRDPKHLHTFSWLLVLAMAWLRGKSAQAGCVN
mmetsp:Transcript_10598/g.39938  ORF Transcript_10598/g.39938 Transcript_10598/m.39938 type:complete len:113 (+) Transcript_10598:1120-1458(+)